MNSRDDFRKLEINNFLNGPSNKERSLNLQANAWMSKNY